MYIPDTSITVSEIQKPGIQTDLWMPVVGDTVPVLLRRTPEYRSTRKMMTTLQTRERSDR